MRKTIIIFYIIIFTGICKIFAQNTNQYLMSGSAYSEAVNLYQEEKYHIAQQKFNEIIKNKVYYTDDEVEGSYYYHALCAIELLNPDAEYNALFFKSIYPSSGKTDQLEFETGRYFYRDKDFKKALKWFDEVNPSRLQSEDRDEYYFSSGYCYFVNDSIDKARLKFYEIKDKEGVYSVSSLYYYSHINYSQKNYQTALEGFEKLKKDTTFATIVPYYISQIYFLQEKYKDVIAYAGDFLEKVTEKRKAEVARFIAESHFKLKQYEQAIPYYNIYTENSTEFTEEDYYQTGYSYYKVEKFDKAAELFEKISDNNSKLGQNASYHLADCYIKLGNKQKALIAFSNASKSDFDPRIKEDALFNKAVLNYELSISPFSETIRDLEEYIETYPNSARKNEAYNYLVLAYLNTKNYNFALTSLSKIKNPNDEIKKAYQQVAFFRGIELVTIGNYEEAIEKFDMSLKYADYNKTLKALSGYWKAECFYRLGYYNDAITSLNTFVLSAGSYQLKEYKTAHYNLGYSYFKTKNYQEALVWFRKYINLEPGENKDILSDAYNRCGDISYLMNDYKSAIKYYDGAVKLNMLDADYALYQIGFANGLLGNYKGKIKRLEELINSYESSSYIDDALFEIAVSYQLLNNLDKAESYLIRLVNNYKGSNYEKAAMVQLGLIYYNANKTDDAINIYKKVILQYPGTDEATSALKGLKNIYIEKSEVETYLTFVNELGGQVKITRTETDSLLFTNAENIYFKGDYDKAIVKLNEYLKQYAKSAFAKTANLYLADCYKKQDREKEALKIYAIVIDMPGQDYKEQALLESSRINYSNEEFGAALMNYKALEEVAELDENILEAQLGMMRCEYKLEKHYDVIATVNKLLKREILEDHFKREAVFYLAKSYMALKMYDQALESFTTISDNLKTIEGAEAKFRISEIYYIKKDFTKAEEEILNFTKINSPHQFWVAKSLLLLSEIFIHRDDYFQASHTVQSILDYYEDQDDGIISEAKGIKLKIEDHKQKELEKENNDLELYIENN